MGPIVPGEHRFEHRTGNGHHWAKSPNPEHSCHSVDGTKQTSFSVTVAPLPRAPILAALAGYPRYAKA
jgi:hypothetical protein